MAASGEELVTLDQLKTVYSELQSLRDSVSRVEYGSVSIDPIAETVMTVNVEFERPFAATPWVSLEIKTSVPQRVWAGVQNRSATGFVLCLYRTNATNTVVNWRAEGK